MMKRRYAAGMGMVERAQAIEKWRHMVTNAGIHTLMGEDVQELVAKSASQPRGAQDAIRGAAGHAHRRADDPGERRRAEITRALKAKGVRVMIDPKAIMFLIGTEMDYVEEKLKSGFTFRNPNEKGRCGCGESFSQRKALRSGL